jgi:apolipoprotein N-acyltransferase
MVQGNVSQDLKWGWRSSEPRGALPSCAEPRVGQSTWWSGRRRRSRPWCTRKSGYLEDAGELAAAAGSEMLLGILRYDFRTRQYHNTLVSLGGHAGDLRKRQLVPFGEYFPVPAWVRRWIAR